jgi:predicted HNH restriction endonuclease
VEIIGTIPIKKCKQCGLEATNEEELRAFTLNKGCTYGREHRCRKCANKNKVDRARNNKVEAIIDKGGRCSNCNMFYNGKNGAAFQFHHLDKNTKESDIARLIGRSYKKLKEELEKCILVCANCHSIIHGTEF